MCRVTALYFNSFNTIRCNAMWGLDLILSLFQLRGVSLISFQNFFIVQLMQCKALYHYVKPVLMIHQYWFYQNSDIHFRYQLLIIDTSPILHLPWSMWFFELAFFSILMHRYQKSYKGNYKDNNYILSCRYWEISRVEYKVFSWLWV